MAKHLLWVLAILTFGFGGQRGASDVKMPDGPGKATVQAACTSCHDLQMLTRGYHDRQDWQLTLDRMIAAGANVPANEIATVTDYLVKNFPGTPPPPAKILTGNAKVKFNEWTLPTKGSRPHDPLAASDGSIWYTGMYANVLGHVDVKTGKI